MPDWTKITEEAVTYLRDLVRIDTTNPPGNEEAAAHYVNEVLATEGISAQVLPFAPGRANLVARLEGSGAKRPLLLMSHLDVVPAEPEKWRHPPFAAELVDGVIWGRGTTDCKDLTVKSLMAMLLAKRQGLALERDLILAATGAEETGGAGMAYLAGRHPELIDCEYALNEGGGFSFHIGDQEVFTCQTAEKGACRFRLIGRDTPGHGSIPRDDHAVVRLADAVSSLAKTGLPYHSTKTTDAFLEALSPAAGMPAEELARRLSAATPMNTVEMLPFTPELSRMLYAVTHNTVTPNQLQAGTKVNVIPSEAEALVDGRTLPGVTQDDFLGEVAELLGEHVEVEVINAGSPLEADYDTPLFDTINQVMAELAPGSVVTPYLVSGGTDAKRMTNIGAKVYGFNPAREEGGLPITELWHNHDERISVENLAFGLRAYYEVVSRFATGA